jgi:hypothetical protein
LAIRVRYNVLVAFVSKEGGGTHFGFVHRHLITGSRERATFPKCAIWPEIAQAQPVLTTLFDKSFLQSLSVDESVWKGDRTPFPTLPSLSAVGDLREEVKFAKDSLLEGAVHCELVSEVKIPAPVTKLGADSGRVMDDSGIVKRC